MSEHLQALSARAPGKRMVSLEGGRNFRDLGGYVTDDERMVRWGLLFRAGSPVNLTEQDWSHLKMLGVRAVCDLRTSREREREPFVWADAEGLAYWAPDHEASFAELKEMMDSGFLTLRPMSLPPSDCMAMIRPCRSWPR